MILSFPELECGSQWADVCNWRRTGLLTHDPVCSIDGRGVCGLEATIHLAAMVRIRWRG